MEYFRLDSLREFNVRCELGLVRFSGILATMTIFVEISRVGEEILIRAYFMQSFRSLDCKSGNSEEFFVLSPAGAAEWMCAVGMGA